MCDDVKMVKVFEDTRYAEGPRGPRLAMSLLKFYTYHEFHWPTWTYVVTIKGWPFGWDADQDPAQRSKTVMDFRNDAEAIRWAITEFDLSWESLLEHRNEAERLL